MAAPIFRGGACSNFSGGCGGWGVFFGGYFFGGGACSNFSGGVFFRGVFFRGGGACSIFRNTVTVRPVRILLECILVSWCIFQKDVIFFLLKKSWTSLCNGKQNRIEKYENVESTKMSSKYTPYDMR